MIIYKINPSKIIPYCPILHNEILKQIKNLDTVKAIQKDDVPTKLLKQKSYFFSNFFHKNANRCIKNSKFPSELKLAYVILCYKKKSRTSKDKL